MRTTEWRKALGDVVREFFRSPEMESFYSVKVTTERAKLYVLQLSVYTRNRRNFWAQTAANCGEMDVKRQILAHEYEELVEDEHSSVGHLDLVVRQGRELGLSQQEVVAAQPLPTTKAANYAWFWIARHSPWQESLACSSIAEWTNDDRLLGDMGGGNCTRLLKNWTRDLAFRPEQMPNFTAHAKADEKHADMFLELLERHVPPEGEKALLRTAMESMELHRVYFGGMATTMARMPEN